VKTDELFALLRRRGFLWPSAEIYGGSQGFFDYGPLGLELKHRIEEAWRSWFVGLSDDYHLVQPAEVLPEAVVRASGHLENFTDPEVTCDSCQNAFRAETVLEKLRPEGVDGLSPAQIGELVVANRIPCPHCGRPTLSVAKPFNLMFGVDLGVTGRERGYLAPETAQGSFLAFARMYDVGRKSLPLGIAVVGKAYRNEIAPRQVLFRMRSFTQAELQIFFDPVAFPVPFASVAEEQLPVLRVDRRGRGEEAPEWVAASELVASGGLPEFYVFHLAHTVRFYRDVLGYPADRLRLFEKSDQERAFYNKIQFDVELRLDSLGGYKELGAIHYRGDYDLTRHSEGSGRDLSVLVAEGRRVLPHVLELTFGVDRNLWALADAGLKVDGDRTLWSLRPYLAPAPVGVFPLLKREHAAYALALVDRLRDGGVRATYDDGGSIGRRYARMDEVGTPFCVTVDGETVDPSSPNHDTVTVRARDSKSQERWAVEALAERLRPLLAPPRAKRAGAPSNAAA